jgi:hypothetical protein
MIRVSPFLYISILFLACLSLVGCNKNRFKKNDYTAYLGGEITNPTNRYVVLYKDNVIIDSILLDENNRFIKKYDSLAPGLYTFKNEPEAQHIYFEKNDSLLFSVDAKNFDNTLVFGGRGDLKNNFLVEMDIKSDNDKDFLFNAYIKPYNEFIPILDSVYNEKLAYYKKRKEKINWSEEFDIFAKSYINFNHYVRLELYPYIYYRRTGSEVMQQLPKNYYNFRKKIDINDERLISFQPFTSYLMAMLNNIVYEDCLNETDMADIALYCNIEKLKISNEIFKSEKIKNIILDNTAFLYLLEDQNLKNNKKFLENYFKFSTDTTAHPEILKIYNNAQSLKPGTQFPDEILSDINGNKKSLRSIINSPTVIYFWSSRTPAHLIHCVQKIKEYKQLFPHYRFIGINIDDSYINWKKSLNNFKPENPEDFFHNSNYKNSREKWLISKIQRTIILDANGTIKDAFANLVEANFIDHL